MMIANLMKSELSFKYLILNYLHAEDVLLAQPLFKSSE